MVILIGSISGGAFYFSMSPIMGDAGAIIQIIIFSFGLGALILTLFQFKQALSYLKAKGGWRVEVSDSELRWDSPVEHIQKSFNIKFDEIKYIESVTKSNHDSGTLENGQYTKFFIYKRDNSRIEIKGDIDGIWPFRVFKELKKRGLKYIETDIN